MILDVKSPDPAQCRARVVEYMGLARWESQCSRKPGHGPDAAYCKQHSMGTMRADLRWWTLDWRGVPEPVMIQGFTEKSVIVNGGRVPRFSDHSPYFPTWLEAYAYVRQAWKDDIASAERKLECARARLAEIEAWTEPVAKEATDV